MAISNIGAKETVTMTLSSAAKTIIDALGAPQKDAIGLAVTLPSAANTVGFGASTGSEIFGVIQTYDKKSGKVAVQVAGVAEAKIKAALAYAAAMGVNDSGEVVAFTNGTTGKLLAEDATALTAEILL